MQSRFCFPGKLRIFFLGFDNSKYMGIYENSHKAFYSSWKKAKDFFFIISFWQHKEYTLEKNCHLTEQKPSYT